MDKATQFFYDNAGWSYTPGQETEDEGQFRCAVALAIAEKAASEAGWYCRWELLGDYCLSSDWIDDHDDGGRNNDPWETWGCCLYKADGELIGALSGIDFGRDGEPWGNSYRRVVEAQLALEAGHEQ